MYSKEHLNMACRATDGDSCESPATSLPATTEPGPAVGAKAEDVLALLRDWFSLSETQRRASAALIGEAELISDLMENSVGELSSRFQSMAGTTRQQHTRLNEAIEEAASVQLGERSVTISELVQFIHDRLTAIIDHVLESSRQEQLVLEAMNGILADVSGIEVALNGIEKVNVRTAYLALNARIEASRAGEAGQGFAIIAQEMQELAKSINSCASQVRGDLQRIADGVVNGHEIIERLASVDMSDNLAAQDDIANSMWHLTNKNERLNDAIRESAQSVDRISDDVSSAVTVMQFQDRAKQRLENMSDTLSVLEQVFRDLQNRTTVETSLDHNDVNFDEDWLKALIHDRTLGEMRERFVRHIMFGEQEASAPTASDAASGATDDDDDGIELF